MCERWVGDGDRLLHIEPSSFDHSSTSFSSWLRLLNRGSLRAQSPLSAAGVHFGILSPTDSNWLEPPRAPGYIIVLRTPASAVLPLIYTGASLDWRLGRGSICYIITRFSSIWPIDTTQKDATTLGQSGHGSDGNERLLHIPQSSSITRASPSDYFV